jgi:hypothetical protein
MKIALLPDGSSHEFPPDTPDDEMDRAVREKLGVAEPTDLGVTLVEITQVIAQQAQAQQAVIEQMAAQLAAQYECVERLEQAIGRVNAGQQDALAMLAEGFARLERAYSAPRMLITDASGKPLGVKTGNDNGA